MPDNKAILILGFIRVSTEMPDNKAILILGFIRIIMIIRNTLGLLGLLAIHGLLGL